MVRASTRQELLLANLHKFYADESHMKRIIPIISGESNVSLRLLDWFVTNYAKAFPVLYEIETSPGERSYFMVYSHYKSQLKAYSKKQFDPFCRRKRVEFCYNGRDAIETTIGQLNFFRWAILHGVLDYVTAHVSEIEQHMNMCTKEGSNNGSVDDGEPSISPAAQSSSSTTTVRRKKRQTPKPKDSIISRHFLPVTVQFETRGRLTA